MPIDNKIDKLIIDKIKNENDPILKTKLIGLYDLLIKIYESDDNYDKKSRKENFKYNNKVNELFRKILDVIQGEKNVTLSDLKEPEKYFNKQEIEMVQIIQDQQTNKDKISWLEMLTKVPYLSSLISDNDKKLLASLQNIEVINYEDSDNYQLEFTFEQNEYFENEKLKVTVVINEDEDFEDGIEEFKGDMIEWKQGKNYLIEYEAGEEKRKEVSFFWFFKSFKAIDYEEDQLEDVVEYDLGTLSDRNLFQNSIDIFNILKEDLMIYIVPQIYGVQIKQFEEDQDNYTDIDSEDNQLNFFQKC